MEHTTVWTWLFKIFKMWLIYRYNLIFSRPQKHKNRKNSKKSNVVCTYFQSFRFVFALVSLWGSFLATTPPLGQTYPSLSNKVFPKDHADIYLSVQSYSKGPGNLRRKPQRLLLLCNKLGTKCDIFFLSWWPL